MKNETGGHGDKRGKIRKSKKKDRADIEKEDYAGIMLSMEQGGGKKRLDEL